MTIKEWISQADNKDAAGLLLNIVKDFLTVTDRDTLSWHEAMMFFETVSKVLDDEIGTAEYGAKDTAFRVMRKMNALKNLTE